MRSFSLRGNLTLESCCSFGEPLSTAPFRDTLAVSLQCSSGVGVAKCDCCIIGTEEVLISLPQNPHLTKFRVVEHFEVQGFVFAHLASFLFEAVSVARSPWDDLFFRRKTKRAVTNHRKTSEVHNRSMYGYLVCHCFGGRLQDCTDFFTLGTLQSW